MSEINLLNADHQIGGFWGHHVRWHDGQFGGRPLNKGTFSVWGHKPRIPRVGQTLSGEFSKIYALFEFVDVEGCRDPADMFFGKVRLIAYQVKGEQEVHEVKLPLRERIRNAIRSLKRLPSWLRYKAWSTT